MRLGTIPGVWGGKLIGSHFIPLLAIDRILDSCITDMLLQYLPYQGRRTDGVNVEEKMKC